VSDLPPPPPPSESFGTPAPSSGADIGAALSYGWNKFTQNVGPLIGIIVAPIVVLFLVYIVGFALVRNFFGFFIVFALALLIQMVAFLGIFNAGLMATRGERVDFGKAFTTDRWGEWIGFSIVYGIMLGVGYLICGVGALVVIAFWGLAPFYFLDQKKGIGDSLSASLATTRSKPGLPLALAVTALVARAGGLVCIGGLITYPLGIIAAAFLYRWANGQQAAA
jgi:hypothetical protein